MVLQMPSVEVFPPLHLNNFSKRISLLTNLFLLTYRLINQWTRSLCSKFSRVCCYYRTSSACYWGKIRTPYQNYSKATQDKLYKDKLFHLTLLLHLGSGPLIRSTNARGPDRDSSNLSWLSNNGSYSFWLQSTTFHPTWLSQQDTAQLSPLFYETLNYKQT